MLDDIFLPERTEDKYLRAADQRSGAFCVLTGVAANRCLATGGTVEIADLVSKIGYPDYAAMPTCDAALSMPEKV